MNGGVNSFVWENNFPSIYGHTSVSFLKRCAGFYEAKHGNMQAALTVVRACIKPKRVIELKQKYPNAVLLPVVTDNRLPEALALAIGLQIHVGINQLKSYERKNLSAMERLLYSPCFNGTITKGKRYILVDDIVTQGGTISALRRYVIIHGGIVVAAVALAFSVNSRAIAPELQDILELTDRFNLALISEVLKKYQIANDVRELTSSQVRYLLRFKELNHIINKIEKSGNKLI